MRLTSLSAVGRRAVSLLIFALLALAGSSSAAGAGRRSGAQAPGSAVKLCSWTA